MDTKVRSHHRRGASYDVNLEKIKKKLDEITINKEVAKTLKLEKASNIHIDECVSMLAGIIAEHELIPQIDITVALDFPNKLAGVCSTTDLGNGLILINGLVVRDIYRDKGVATRLMSTLLTTHKQAKFIVGAPVQHMSFFDRFGFQTQYMTENRLVLRQRTLLNKIARYEKRAIKYILQLIFWLSTLTPLDTAT